MTAAFVMAAVSAAGLFFIAYKLWRLEPPTMNFDSRQRRRVG